MENGVYKIPVEAMQGYFVERGIKTKKVETPNPIQVSQAEDRLYHEMKDRIEEMKARIAFLEKTGE